MELTKEKIMAYVDGELDPAGSAEVKSAIDSDETAAAQLEIFRRSRDLLIQKYGKIRSEPVPDYLINAVLEHPGATREPYRERGAAMRRRISEPVEKPGFKKFISNWPVHSMAASLVLGLILGSSIISTILDSDRDGDSRYLNRNIDKNRQNLAIGLAREMSENPDKTRYEIIIGDSIVVLRPRSDFTNASGESCKLMETSSEPALELNQKFVVTCRDSDNDWYTYQ